MERKTEWFENWFDTSYYHLLYDYRDEQEAVFFMNNLIQHLGLQKGNSILDLPCGMGRHAMFLSSQGFKVVGADLSVNNILQAKRSENDNLRFTQHDMRDPLSGSYHAIFNLFTSFGYFEKEETNIAVLRNFKNALYPHGHLVIDFLNLHKVRSELVPEQHFFKNNIEFIVKKTIDNNFIIKEIEVIDANETHHFIEKVQALDLTKIRRFAKAAGLEIDQVFGDYDLHPFLPQSSERLILVMR